MVRVGKKECPWVTQLLGDKERVCEVPRTFQNKVLSPHCAVEIDQGTPYACWPNVDLLWIVISSFKSKVRN